MRALSVAADRPRPGRDARRGVSLRADSRAAGTPILLGLDEARHPGADLEDPVLLDAERRGINRVLAPLALPLYRDRPRESARALKACVARLLGRADGELLELESAQPRPAERAVPVAVLSRPLSRPLRRARGRLHGAAPRPFPRPRASFPASTRRSTRPSGGSRVSQAAGPAAAAGAAAPIVRAFYPHLADGHRAEEQRDSRRSSRSTTGGSARARRSSIRASAASPSRPRASRPSRSARSATSCRHVLRIEPPKEIERDPTEWLDAMTAGSLLHEVFRLFFERITEAGEKPEAARHAALIETIAGEQIAAWREKVPPASELAFGQRRDDILVACRTFLALEEEHCREMTPRYFEIPFGLPARRVARRDRQPRARVDRGRGRRVLSAARLDRPRRRGARRLVPRLGLQDRRHLAPQGEARHPRRPADPARPLRDGARGRSSGAPGSPAPVSRSGYFFPGRKGEGQRMPMALDLAGDARRPRAPARPASRGDVSPRRRQGRLPLLRLRGRLRRCARRPRARSQTKLAQTSPAGPDRPSGRSMAKTEAEAAALPDADGAPRDLRGPRHLAARRGRRRHGQDDEPRRADDRADSDGRRDDRPPLGRHVHDQGRRGAVRAVPDEPRGGGARGEGRRAARCSRPRSRASTPPSSGRSTPSARACCASGPSRPAWTRAFREMDEPENAAARLEAWGRYTERLFTGESPCSPASPRSASASRTSGRPTRRSRTTRTWLPAIGPEEPPPDFSAERAAGRDVSRARGRRASRRDARRAAGPTSRRPCGAPRGSSPCATPRDAPAFAQVLEALHRARKKATEAGRLRSEFETLCARRSSRA